MASYQRKNEALKVKMDTLAKDKGKVNVCVTVYMYMYIPICTGKHACTSTHMYDCVCTVSLML